LFDLEDEVTSKRKEMKNATLSKAELGAFPKIIQMVE
jgi:hypothetical protein